MVWTRASVVRMTVARVTVARVAAIAVIAVAALAAGGCSDDEPEPGPAPPVESSSGSTSPSGSSSPGPDDGAPVAPPEMDRADEAGAEAFAKHYFALVNHAQATGELEALEAVSGADCAACQGGIDWVRDIVANDRVVEGGGYRVERAVARRSATRSVRTFDLDLTVMSPKQRVLDAEDHVVERYPGGTTAMVMQVEHGRSDGWLVTYWRTS